jgi:transposase InsO family protein
MSRRGNCYDKAPMESLYKNLKVEEVYPCEYETHEQAIRGVRDYIDRFYNRERMHSSLGYMSPTEYESLRL